MAEISDVSYVANKMQEATDRATMLPDDGLGNAAGGSWAPLTPEEQNLLGPIQTPNHVQSVEKEHPSTSDLVSSHLAAQNITPDQAAENIELSKYTGAPISSFAGDPVRRKEIIEISRSNMTYNADYSKIVNDYPGIARVLADPNLAALAKEDLDGLNFIEWTGKSLYQGVRKNLLEGKINDLVSKARKEKNFTKYEADIAKVEEELAPIYANEPKGWNIPYAAASQGPNWAFAGGMALRRGVPMALAGAGAAFLLGQAGPQAAAPEEILTVPAAAGWGFRTGAAIGAGEYAYHMESNSAFRQYMKLRDKDGNPISNDIIERNAHIVGLVNAGLETGGDIILLGTIGKPVAATLMGIASKTPAAAPLVKLITGNPQAFTGMTLKGALLEAGKQLIRAEIGEVGTEVLQEMSTSFGGEMAKRQSGGQFEYSSMGDILKQSSMVISPTFQAVLPFGLIGGASSVYNFRQESMANAQTVKDFNTAKAGFAADSKILDKSPEAFTHIMATVNKENGTEISYIPADDFVTYFQSKSIDPVQAAAQLGVDKSALDEALESGTMLAINDAKMVTELGKTEHLKALVPDITNDPSQPTFRQIERIENESAAAIKATQTAAVKEADQLLKDNPERADEYQRAYAMIKDARLAAENPDGMKEKDFRTLVENESKIWASWAVVEAEKRGISVGELMTGQTMPMIMSQQGAFTKLGPTDNVGNITIAEATAKIMAGDITVIPELEKAAAQYGATSVLDAVVEHGLGQAEQQAIQENVAKGMTQGEAVTLAQQGFKKILPQLREIKDNSPGVLEQKRILNQSRTFTPDVQAYKGYAKDNGLDKKGLNDRTINWLDTWTNIDMEENAKNIGTPPSDVVETLSKFRPEKPATLYRGVPAGKSSTERLANITGYESWTRNKKTAEKWAGKDGNVEQRVFQPDDILVDFGKLPKDYFDINGNIEKEVIVKGKKELFQSPTLAPTFFYKSERLIQDKMPPTATVEQVKGILKEVKEDERKWLGIDEFLAGKTKITKQELLDHIRANDLQIKEVMKGGPEYEDINDVKAKFDEAHRKMRDIGLELDADPDGLAPYMSGSPLHWMYKDENGKPQDVPAKYTQELDRLSKEIQNYEDILSEQDTSYPFVDGHIGTRFAQWQVPGGKDYRELLITLPVDAQKETAAFKSAVDEMNAKYPNEDPDVLSYGTRDMIAMVIKKKTDLKKFLAVRDAYDAAKEKERGGYHSSHFSEPNILAHIRFNTREDENGKKVLFIEEVQSDWHQAGREQGYAVKGEVTEQTIKEVMAEYGGTREEAIKLIQNEKTSGVGVPDAPFKKTWHELALRRMVRYAAENGYDKIAWTTGEQQNDRYDLSKQIDEIHYKKKSDGTFDIVADKDGRALITKQGIAANEIEGLVGKDVAKKIVDGVSDGKSMGFDVLKAANLTVGGEGMRGFYDQMIPQYLNKFGKKWGAKVVKEKTLGPFMENQSMDITPEMRRSALQEGFTLFQRPYEAMGKYRGEAGKEFIIDMINEERMRSETGKPLRGAFMTDPLPNGKYQIYINKDSIKRGVDGEQITKRKAINHEIAHYIWRHTLTEAERKTISDQFKYKDEKYHAGTKKEEHFAGVFDLWVQESTRMQKEEWLKTIKDVLDKKFDVDYQSADKYKRTLLQAAAVPSTQYQDNPIIDPQGSTEFTPNAAIIRLFKTADRSTFMHESAHVWLNSMEQYVKSGKADAAYLQDWKTLTDWLGVKDGQKELTVAQHEQFARGFEAYLMEGNAPSEGLRRTFKLFKNWLVRIYRDVRRLNVALTNDVRGVMDRMLAGEEEVAAARDFMGYAANIAGLDPAVAGQIDKLQREAHDQAVEQLVKEQMKEISAEQKQAVERYRESRKDDISDQVNGMQVYKASDDHATFLAKLPDGVRSKDYDRVMDIIAERNGYTSADEMSRAFMDMKPKAELKKELLDSEVASKFPDLRNTEKIRELAERAVHNDKQLEVMALEKQSFESMLKKTIINEEVKARRANERRITVAAIKAKAKDLLLNKPIKEASAFRVYYTAERNAAIEVAKAQAAKDWQAAANAKSRQILNHALATEAIRINRQWEKMDAYLTETARKDQALFKKEEHFVQVAAILDRFGYARGDFDANVPRETLQEWATAMDEITNIVNIPDWIMNETIRKTPESLTVKEFTDVVNAVKNITKVANFEKRAFALADGADLAVIQKDLIEAAEKNVKKKHELKAEPGRFDAMINMAAKYITNLKKTQTILLALDGFKDGGKWFNTFWRSMYDAANKESRMMKAANEGIVKLWSVYSAKERQSLVNDRIYVPEFGDSPTKMRLLVMALNLGNADNKQKMFNNRPVWVAANKEWNEQVVMKVLSRHLDTRDWQFVQNAWDLIESLWPEAAEMHKDLTGFAPGKIEAVPLDVTASDGTRLRLPGGYYPLKQDPNASMQAAIRDEQLGNPLWEENNPAWKSMTNTGYTKERTGAQYPIQLDISVLNRHLRDVIHDISFRPTIIDLKRIIRDPDIQTALRRNAGPEGAAAIREWVASVASGNAIDKAGTGALESFVGALRRRASIAVLMLRPSVILQNFANPFLYAGAVEGFGAPEALHAIFVRGLTDYIPKAAFNWKEAQAIKDFVYSLSPFMRDRRNTPDYSLQELHGKLFGQDPKLQQFAIGLMSGSDELSGIPFWLEAYNKKLNEGATQKDAVAYADMLIDRVLGSGRKYDTSAISRGGELAKSLSMFYNFFNTELNRWMREYGIAKEDIKNLPRFTGFVASRMLIFNTLSLLLSGQLPKKDDDKLKWWLKQSLRYPMGFFPGFREIGGLAIDKALGLQSFGYRPSPVVGGIETFGTAVGTTAQALAGKKDPQQALEDISHLTSYAVPYPDMINNWFWNAYDYAMHGMEPQPGDVYRRRPKRKR